MDVQKVTATKMTTDEFTAMLDNASIDWWAYSGRGMYGARCVAVENVEPLDLVETILVRVVEPEQGGGTLTTRDVIAAVKNPSRDDLGKGFVIYWRDMEIED